MVYVHKWSYAQGVVCGIPCVVSRKKNRRPTAYPLPPDSGFRCFYPMQSVFRTSVEIAGDAQWERPGPKPFGSPDLIITHLIWVLFWRLPETAPMLLDA